MPSIMDTNKKTSDRKKKKVILIYFRFVKLSWTFKKSFKSVWCISIFIKLVKNIPLGK